MPSLKIYGASDDLVEVDGDIYDEFSYGAGPGFLGFSDGTLLSIEYGAQGIWHVNVLFMGQHTNSIWRRATSDEGNHEDGMPAYSDVLTLVGDFDWVVYGDQKAKRRE